MTKVPTDCRGKKVIKILKKFGWEGCRGSKHTQLIHPDFNYPISVPCHSKPVKKGLLSKIIKDVSDERNILTRDNTRLEKEVSKLVEKIDKLKKLEPKKAANKK